jgi:hypothetical protein
VNKYGIRPTDCRILRILGGYRQATPLLSAAFADSTWNKIICALNIFETFADAEKISVKWPLNSSVISRFLHWALFVKNLSPNSIGSYMSHLKLIHKLRGLNTSACEDHFFKYQLRGAKNLNFYTVRKKVSKKAMSLPLLKIIGHEIAASNWSDDSKLVTWAACCVGFFGSFRMGELLPKCKRSFNPFESLLWDDIVFFEDNSIQLHNKIPKSRTEHGEHISLFEFKNHNCCPVLSLSLLKSKRSDAKYLSYPVFAFENGTFLTKSKLNNIIHKCLQPHIQDEATLYSCKSFRAALPSALAALPCSSNEKFIKRWGRWNSEAFERYVRLSHLAKKRIFKKFELALNS